MARTIDIRWKINEKKGSPPSKKQFIRIVTFFKEGCVYIAKPYPASGPRSPVPVQWRRFILRTKKKEKFNAWLTPDVIKYPAKFDPITVRSLIREFMALGVEKTRHRMLWITDEILREAALYTPLAPLVARRFSDKCLVVSDSLSADIFYKDNICTIHHEKLVEPDEDDLDLDLEEDDSIFIRSDDEESESEEEDDTPLSFTTTETPDETNQDLLIDKAFQTLLSWRLAMAPDVQDYRIHAQARIILTGISNKHEEFEPTAELQTTLVNMAKVEYQKVLIKSEQSNRDALFHSRYNNWYDWVRDSFAVSAYESITQLSLTPLSSYFRALWMDNARIRRMMTYLAVLLFVIRYRRLLMYPFKVIYYYRKGKQMVKQQRLRKPPLGPRKSALDRVAPPTSFVSTNLNQGVTVQRDAVARRRLNSVRCHFSQNVHAANPRFVNGVRHQRDDIFDKPTIPRQQAKKLTRNWREFIAAAAVAAKSGLNGTFYRSATCTQRPLELLPDVAHDARISKFTYEHCPPRLGTVAYGIAFNSLPAITPKSCRCNEYICLRTRVTRLLTPYNYNPTTNWRVVPMPPVLTYDYDGWLQHLEPKKRDLYMSALQLPLDTKNLGGKKTFEKIECNLKYPEKIDPRAVQGCYPLANLATGAAVYSFMKDFVPFVNRDSSNNVQFVLPYGWTEDELAHKLTDLIDNFLPKTKYYYIEADGKRMDASIHPAVNGYVRKILAPYLNRFELGDAVLAENERIFGKTRHGISYKVGHGLCSGVQWTAMNHCVYMWKAINLCLPCFPMIFCNKGDDVWIVSAGTLNQTVQWLRKFRAMLKKWGLLITAKVTDKMFHSEFLAMRPFISSGQVYLFPKIGRFLPKLGWTAKPYDCVSNLDRCYAVAQGLRHLRNTPVIGPYVRTFARLGIPSTYTDLNREWKYKSVGCTIPDHAITDLEMNICEFYEVDATHLSAFEYDMDHITRLPIVVDSELMIKAVEKDLGAYYVSDSTEDLFLHPREEKHSNSQATLQLCNRYSLHFHYLVVLATLLIVCTNTNSSPLRHCTGFWLHWTHSTMLNLTRSVFRQLNQVRVLFGRFSAQLP